MRIKKKYIIVFGFILFCFISLGYFLLQTTIKSTNTVSISLIPMIMSYFANWNHDFFSSTFRVKVKNIFIDDQIRLPSNAIEEWDVSANQDGSIIAYYIANAIDSNLYDLYIEGNDSIYTNYQSNDLLRSFSNLQTVSGIEKLNTSLTTNTSHMFSATSHHSGVQVTLNYTINNETLVDDLIGKKSAQTNLVKGVLIF